MIMNFLFYNSRCKIRESLNYIFVGFPFVCKLPVTSDLGKRPLVWRRTSFIFYDVFGCKVFFWSINLLLFSFLKFKTKTTLEEAATVFLSVRFVVCFELADG